jgi:DNA-binding transcriptional regulator YdaS (Cro superfamily)
MNLHQIGVSLDALNSYFDVSSDVKSYIKRIYQLLGGHPQTVAQVQNGRDPVAAESPLVVYF